MNIRTPVLLRQCFQQEQKTFSQLALVLLHKLPLREGLWNESADSYTR